MKAEQYQSILELARYGRVNGHTDLDQREVNMQALRKGVLTIALITDAETNLLQLLSIIGQELIRTESMWTEGQASLHKWSNDVLHAYALCIDADASALEFPEFPNAS